MSRFPSSGRRDFLKWALATGFSTVLLDRGKTWAQNPADTSALSALRIRVDDLRNSFLTSLFKDRNPKI